MAVEDLRVGDRVDTLFRGLQPIKWIGMGRSLVTPANRDEVRPVIVRRGALGENEPCRDLYLTKGHCLLIGASLIPVILALTVSVIGCVSGGASGGVWVGSSRGGPMMTLALA